MLIHSKVILPQAEEMKSASVKGRYKDTDGNIFGNFKENLIINLNVYNVEFPDDVVEQYAANNISENMYTKLYQNGCSYYLIDAVIDYSKDGRAVSKDNGYVIIQSGTRRLRQTTTGWKFLILWKDETE